jgi:hypothetical protein
MWQSCFSHARALASCVVPESETGKKKLCAI